MAGQHVLIGRDQAEFRDVAVVHHDLPLALVIELNRGVGRDHAVVVAGETPGRHGLELGELRQALADAVHLEVEQAGLTLLHVVAHQRAQLVERGLAVRGVLLERKRDLVALADVPVEQRESAETEAPQGVLEQ